MSDDFNLRFFVHHFVLLLPVKREKKNSIKQVFDELSITKHFISYLLKKKIHETGKKKVDDQFHLIDLINISTFT